MLRIIRLCFEQWRIERAISKLAPGPSAVMTDLICPKCAGPLRWMYSSSEYLCLGCGYRMPASSTPPPPTDPNQGDT
jgi:hypothetical protein